MIEYIQSNKKGLILVIIGLITLFLMISNTKTFEVKEEINYDIQEVEANVVIDEDDLIHLKLNEYNEVIHFYADTFQIEYAKLYDLLVENYDSLEIETADNFDKVLINYLFSLESTNKNLFSNKITACDKSKEYMLSLINYYTSIYDNVDFKVAASIAHIESGYKAASMLKVNNIFGGIYNNKLIKYKNIEYGILKYIKLLSENYYALGRNTIEKIGKVYNPIIVDGVKMANPTWVKNVKSVMNKYQDYDLITNVLEIKVD